ncbi:MAG: hypothetical protein QXU88_02100 [Candidatus Woesearchaeota archaeon]
MFIRQKRIKGKKYAYLVENAWTKNGPRQKVISYLGSINSPEKIYEKEPELGSRFQDSLKKLFENELFNHGFAKNGADGSFAKEDMTVDLRLSDVRLRGKPAVLALNDGFLCTKTMKDIFGLKPVENKEQSAILLANSLLVSGLKIGKELFVKLFEQFEQMKQDGSQGF